MVYYVYRKFYMHDLAAGMLLGIDELRRQVSPAADVLGTPQFNGSVMRCFRSSCFPSEHLLWSAVAMRSWMPEITLAKRRLTTPTVLLQIPKRARSHFPPARRRCLLQQWMPNGPLTQRRSFSATALRSRADVGDVLDPRQQDRESDVVDVCIVGGGTCHEIATFDIY